MLQSLSILIIEQDSILKKIITENPIFSGYHICGYFNNVGESIQAIAEDNYDIALINPFLDKKNSGITLGKLINKNYNKPFIFLTQEIDPQLFSDLLSAKPYACLSNLISPESLWLTINSAINHFTKQFGATENRISAQIPHQPFIFIKNGNSFNKIKWSDIVCLRSERNYTAIITNKQEIYMVRSSLQKTLSATISGTEQVNFIQINRAEIIQMSFIEQIVGNDLYANNQIFSITENYARKLRKELRVIV